MNLYDAALIYKTQLLEKTYIIRTDTNEIIIQASEKNFLHLTGIQRANEFHNVKSASDFYNDCLQQRYTKRPLDYSYKNKGDRNIVDMKISNFDKIESAILNAPILYYTKDENNKDGKAISVSFQIKKKNKFVTLVFKSDVSNSYYVPTSIQLDQNLSYGVVPTAYKQETILSVEVNNRT